MTTLIIKAGDRHHHHQFSEQDYQTAVENIKAWYEANVPFFTKDRLQIIQDQLRRFTGESCRIRIPDLNGSYTEDVIEFGKITSPANVEWERAFLKPYIKYRPMQELWAGRTVCPNPYQNIKLACLMGQQRNKETKEPIDPSYGRSISEIEQFFGHVAEDWNRSSQCEQIVSLLVSHPHLTIKKVVAFANGPIACDRRGRHGTDWSMRSAYQHALMLTLKKTFRTIDNFAQDPAYEDADVAVLQQNGIKVVDDPEGFLQADDNTAAISIAPNIPIKQILCDIAKPALLIWFRVQKPVTVPLTDPDSRRVMRMMEEQYECHEFPEGLEVFFGGDTVIYIKKDESHVSGVER